MKKINNIPSAIFTAVGLIFLAVRWNSASQGELIAICLAVLGFALFFVASNIKSKSKHNS